MIEGVAVAPGEGESFIGQIRGELGSPCPKGSDVGRGQMDPIAIRHPRPRVDGATLVLHRSLDPTLDLDRLEWRTEEASCGTFEQPLEEALHRGDRLHGRPESSRRGGQPTPTVVPPASNRTIG